MDDPRYIVLVALDTPSRSTGMYISGGVMAAPTVGAVLADILPYLEVKHNYKEEDLQGRLIPVADLVGLTAKEAKAALEKQGLEAVLKGTGDTVTDQLPATGQSLPGGSQVVIYLGTHSREEMVEVPDFTGMTRQQAFDAAGLLGLYILPKGNTNISPEVKAVSQSVTGGSLAPKGTTVAVTFADTRITP
jgi:stage V sporulation protein D (sporulation-specific penicillin-binding protein)